MMMIDPERVTRDMIEQHADLLKQLVQLAEKNDRLEAELAPWRRMVEQLNALFNADYAVNLEVEMGGFCVATWPNSPEIVDPATMIEVSGMTLPAAVDAAYQQVKGVGDE